MPNARSALATPIWRDAGRTVIGIAKHGRNSAGLNGGTQLRRGGADRRFLAT